MIWLIETPERAFASGFEVRCMLALPLALITGATLMLQSLLTRLFSVLLWYHMSLVCISLAMLGLTFGALLVRSFPGGSVDRRCAAASLGFAVSTLVCLIFCLQFPLAVGLSPASLAGLSLWICVTSLPFIFSGIVVCLCLTRVPAMMARMYAADLFGSALACPSVVVLMNALDTPSCVLLVSVLGLFAGLLFMGWHRRLLPGLVLAAALVLVGLHSKEPLLVIRYVLGKPMDVSKLEHEYWSAFSYVTVGPTRAGCPLWGRGRVPSTREYSGHCKELTMDTRAATYMTGFDGNWDAIWWLGLDQVNLVHQLRPEGSVLVIGAGGGRDVLSALVRSKGHRAVTALEVNPTIFKILTRLEDEYLKLAGQPGARFVHDEARSWLSRSQDRFSVITVSLVDTSAASAAGAYALTENSLYTTQAFQIYLNHLEQDGVLSISRWWHQGHPDETFRLVALAAEALRLNGAERPEDHIVVVHASALATMLVQARPWSRAELAELDTRCATLGFDILTAPHRSLSNDLSDISRYPGAISLGQRGVVKIDLSPPTDDRPYFFHSFSMNNIWRMSNWNTQAVYACDRDAVLVLVALSTAVGLMLVGVLGFCRPARPSGTLYFLALGMGFMAFESALIQRLNLFLGYPTYSLTVVLFGLLLSAAAGSWCFGRYCPDTRKIVVPLLITLALSGWVPFGEMAHWSTPARIALSLFVMAPGGFLLGMMYPLGIQRFASSEEQASLAWVINGAASSSGAIWAIAISLTWGISSLFSLSLACYLVAAAVLFSDSRN